MFINRESELGFLAKVYHEKKAKLIILYGRRRVGKTELLKEFAKKHKGIYLLARQESEKKQLEVMSRELASFFHDTVLEKNPFISYDALFEYIRVNAENIPVFFDEFPFLVASNKSLPSILQYHWDNFLKNKQMYIILCGSSITMMESLLGYSSPLYGRRTEQMLLEPMNFNGAIKFCQNISAEDKVKIYSILGGTPAYLLEFDFKKSIEQNIKERMLNKNNFLYQDVLFVLREELDEPRKYFSIIAAIAKGNTTLGHIMNETGFDKGTAAKYLSVLISLQLVERIVPITEKHPEKSRKGIYRLKDNYFRFWFRFIFENSSYVEQGKQGLLLNDKILPELNLFVGKVYEEIAREWISSKYKEFLFGSWWDKNEEIDIVGISEKKNQIIVGEAKWRVISKKEAESIIMDLQAKVIKSGFTQARKISYVLIAKEFKEKPSIEGVEFYSLKDIVSKKN